MLQSEVTQLLGTMIPVQYAVSSLSRETPDTVTLSLHAKNGGGIAAFAPGQFSMLWFFGVGEVPVSMSGDPADLSRFVYTVRSVGRVSQALMNAELMAPVGVRGPFGVGWPIDAARGRDVIIVAGGLGLAPLRPVIYHVLRNRSQYGRLMIFYGTRRPQDLLFRKELPGWARQPDTQVLTTVDSGGVSWRGHVGVVTTLFRYAAGVDPARSVAMICGPEIMMRFASRELVTLGMSPSDIYCSMERNMKCAVGFCGHCQWSSHFICKDGPVFPYSMIRALLEQHEL